MEQLNLSPEGARLQLKDMFETPESFTRKMAELVEAAQVLQNPARRGKPAPDVFMENVQNRLRGKGIEIELMVPSRPSDPKGVAASTMRPALSVLWFASTTEGAWSKESVGAMEAGENPKIINAAADALYEASGIPGVFRGLAHGTELRDNEVDRAERAFGEGITASVLGRANAVVEYGKELSGWSLGTKIAEEEIENEVLRANREGREPDLGRLSSARLTAMTRGLGEVLMINSIAQSINSVTEEEVIWKGQEQVERAWAQGKANESLRQASGIKNDYQQMMMASLDPRNLDFARKFAEMTESYTNARNAVTRLADATARQFSPDDPLARKLAANAARLPEPVSEDDIKKARLQTAIDRLDAPDPVAPIAEAAPRRFVPNVVGEKAANAKAILTGEGPRFQVSFTASDAPPPSKDDEFTVRSQSPEAGRDVVETTAVVLTVYGAFDPR